MRIKNIYTSAACNRTPESVDWGDNGLIVYAACNSVAILKPEYEGSCKLEHTYVKHSKRVNTVKWVKRSGRSTEIEFLSGSDDKTAILWNIEDPKNPKTYHLTEHKDTVAVLESIENTKRQLIIATASADSTIKIWHYNVQLDQYECSQTISLSTGFCFAIRMAKLPNSDKIVLAYSGDDNKINLLANDETSTEHFVRVHQLIGHEDWVRGLDFVGLPDGDVLLASSSQDTYVRLWRISARNEEDINRLDFLNIPDGDIQIEERIFNVKHNDEKYLRFAISLESVRQAHEGWVYGVHWNNNGNELQLLSSSIDQTIIVWSLSDDGVWMETVRVGEVGGNSLGFFGGKFSSNGKSIVGHGFQGTFHIWNQSESDGNLWTPNVIVGGHFGHVRDLEWEPKGTFLFSVSADQTTRIHAPWKRENQEETWHEIARPQVHGYDMQTIAVLSSYKIASGAEEKIVRIFQAPRNFVENFRQICKITKENDAEGDQIIELMPIGASVPSLGLSNKGVFESESPPVLTKSAKNEYPENSFTAISLHSPPQEETLIQNTLWPEIQKLYGHGFEIYALSASSDGRILASSCRATTAEHAQIILWNTKTWKQIQKLASHQLTVTQMKFSPCNTYLLTVSRDRKWTVFENQPNSGEICDFRLSAVTDKKNGIHNRIIWSCDWSHDSQNFVTSSRDGKAVVWHAVDKSDQESVSGWKASGVVVLKNESITAVAFAQKYLIPVTKTYLIALGLETGIIHLYSFEPWQRLYSFTNDESHHLIVKRLQFRPNITAFQLASCAEDHFVRIYDILFNT